MDPVRLLRNHHRNVLQAEAARLEDQVHVD